MHSLRIFLLKIIISIKMWTFGIYSIVEIPEDGICCICLIHNLCTITTNGSLSKRITTIICRKKHKIMLKVPTHISFKLFISVFLMTYVVSIAGNRVGYWDNEILTKDIDSWESKRRSTVN